MTPPTEWRACLARCREALTQCHWSLDGLEGDDYAGDVVANVAVLIDECDRVLQGQECAGCGRSIHVDPERDKVTHHKRGCPLAASRLALRKAVQRKGQDERR